MTTVGTSEAAAAPLASAIASPIRRPIIWLLLPAGLLAGLLLVCTLTLLRISFGPRYAEWNGWSLAAFVEAFSPYFLSIILNTIWLALVSAVLATVVSFPIALFMVRTSSRLARDLVLICIMLPMVVGLLVQSFGWVAILGPDGLINQVAFLITGEPRTFSLLFNTTGVLLGLVQTTIPLAVLPLVSSLSVIPSDLEEAASVLGARRLQTYRHVILPMAMPGIAAGTILVFGFNTGAFVVPLLLGGSRVSTIAVIIRDQMGTLSNWPLGAALSMALIFIALSVQVAHRHMGSRSRFER
ncbi:ABC transporter permease [Bradyrhizobium cajani]|uniref:ABC transporter permease subunit n=1 Tax=Bradyrhizobium cajani TaxID=1928661 RepID=A0A844TM30_9BRAD|nr:ABC transporter permease [Bradyrhizobium cajani]MCP3371808.1 ABC transporter permease [Bradyrhizobium cajani]MVT76372.1 ABC transporter permease subunit [Bradyrhizobium cajani]